MEVGVKEENTAKRLTYAVPNEERAIGASVAVERKEQGASGQVGKRLFKNVMKDG